jgi:hypothetical protein
MELPTPQVHGHDPNCLVIVKGTKESFDMLVEQRRIWSPLEMHLSTPEARKL